MIKRILLSSSIFLAVNAHAGCLEKVVYGDDNRLDVYASPNNLYKKLAASTAAMIFSSSLESQGDTYTIKSGTLEGDGICSNSRFAKQQTAAACSGFLVGSDLLLTAGHCIETMSDCDSYSWVFDYTNSTSERSVFNINKKDVYKCTKIIARALDDSTDNDFALVKLIKIS